MADNETIADIIDALRKDGDAAFPYDVDHMNTLNAIADRLDAAYKREIDEAERRANHAAIKNVSETLAKVGPLYDAESIGNAAKLRAALAAYLALWDNGTMNNLDELKRVIKQMREALSAPPRNCDVGTTTEQSDRMRHFCLYHQGGCEGCSRRDKGMTFRECVIDWAQTPYKEGGEG